MEFQKQCGDYIILGKLGEGFHSKVKLGVKNGQKVAIKIFKKNHDTAKNIKTFANEINILKLLIHPNIIRLIEFSDALQYRKKNGQIGPRVCIVLELAQGGEFFDYIQKCGTLSEKSSRFYFKQLLASLIFMANKGICHRDLKLENLLLDDKFNLKVADFGLGNFVEAAMLKSQVGTNEYMAPEVKARIPYNGTKVDIYSAGVILYVLIFGEIPKYTNVQNDNLRKQIKLKNEQLIKEAKEVMNISEDLINLIYGMLAQNPDNRFSLDQCMQHPWTNGPMPTQEEIQVEFKVKFQYLQQLKNASLKRQRVQVTKRRQGQIGNFRSTMGENEEECLTQIIEKYQLNFENRVLTKGIEIGFPFEILLYHDDPSFIFCYLLKYCGKFNSKVNEVHDTKYKINFQVIDLGYENIEFSIEILDCGNEMIKLNINKLSGNYLQFKEIVSRIQEAINEIFQDYLQDGIKQE